MCPLPGPRLALVALAALFVAGSSVAGLNEGLDALRNQDFAAAAKELRPLAEEGDAEAQYRIGSMYNYGKSYPQDGKQGLAWLRRSATQGHVAAQHVLDVIYVNGEGLPKDDKEAMSWFRKAATQGFQIAQFKLGVAYELRWTPSPLPPTSRR